MYETVLFVFAFRSPARRRTFCR